MNLSTIGKCLAGGGILGALGGLSMKSSLEAKIDMQEPVTHETAKELKGDLSELNDSLSKLRLFVDPNNHEMMFSPLELGEASIARTEHFLDNLDEALEAAKLESNEFRSAHRREVILHATKL